MPIASFSEPDRELNVPPPPPRPYIGDEALETKHRSQAWLWLAILLLVGAGAFAAFQLIPRLNQYGTQLAKQSGLTDVLSSVGNRMTTAEQKLAAIPARLDSLDHKVSAGLEQARRIARDQGAAAHREIVAAIGTQQEKTDARIRELESAQQAVNARADQIERTAKQQTEQQNAELRQEISALNTRVSDLNQSVNQNIGTVQSAAARDAQQIRDQIRQTDGRVNTVASFVDRPRARFEANVGHTQEIAPGVLLHIDGTNPGYRRFHGWLQLVNDGKILWLRDQSSLQTIAFYSGHDVLRNDLVITDLTKSGVTGYVIFPARGETESGQHSQPPQNGVGGF